MNSRVNLFGVMTMVAFSLGQAEAAFKEVHCPKEISRQDINRLAKRHKLSFNQVSFTLDGGSKAIVKNISHEKSGSFPLAYERLESRKVVCWYKTPEGYLAIRQR